MIEPELTKDNQVFEISYYDSAHDRDLPKSDIERIIEIDMECLAPGIRDVAITKKSNLKFRKAIIIRHRRTIVGVLAYKENPDTIYIDVINVAKSSQSQGLGSILLKQIIDIAEYKNLTLTLTSPPWNHAFYSRFGFKVYRTPLSHWKVQGKDEKNITHDFPIRALEMRNRFFSTQAKPVPTVTSTLILHPKKNLHTDMDLANSAEGRLQIEAVKTLAIFTKNNTSTWYSFFSRSREKEHALETIEEALHYHLSNAPIKNSLTVNELSNTVITIIRNAMIVRGYAFFSDHTTSGNALIKLLSGGIKKNNFISPAQIEIINKLLHDNHNIEIKADSYVAVRSHLFGQESFYSTPIISPYLYQGFVNPKAGSSSFKFK